MVKYWFPKPRLKVQIPLPLSETNPLTVKMNLTETFFIYAEKPILTF